MYLKLDTLAVALIIKEHKVCIDLTVVLSCYHSGLAYIAVPECYCHYHITTSQSNDMPSRTGFVQIITHS